MSAEVHHPTTARGLCEIIGRKRLEEELGVSKASITNAISAGKFPASWFRVVSELCVGKDIQCDMSLFGFKERFGPPKPEPCALQREENEVSHV